MDILSLVVGAVVSIVISELYRILKKKGDYGLIKRRINRLSKSVADSDILTLSQGFPFFEVQHIETRKTARKLIFCFPDELKPQLGEKLKAGFTETEECYLGCRSLEELGEKLNVPDFRTLVEEGKSIVADNFIHRQNGDFFNGNTFGVLRADDYSRTPDSNEHKLLHIDFFNSDYFTHKVIHHVCAELNRRKFLADISADLLNTKYFPVNRQQKVDTRS